MKAQTLVPLAAAAAAQLLVVGNIAAAFAFQQKPPVETLVTVPVVAEIEQVECVRQDPVPYEPVTYQVPLDAELQSYTEKNVRPLRCALGTGLCRHAGRE